ncbi:hypothetical protein GCM10022393_12150 [Aquimarina addita]|uniref:DUF1569 domain-containing protein n=1 Tax=Aquimarina addita TaxID=870485 RepID=A0ABP7XE68_9FLAO
MKSLFNERVYQEIEKRILRLSNTSTPVWGTMDVSQMLHHCQFPLKIVLQKEHPRLKNSLLARLFFKKALYNDKLWRKNLPTHVKLKVNTSKNFNEEQKLLLSLILEFYNKRQVQEWNPHPMFGKFTYEQWGKMQYKHLDHHLRQFNV